MKKQLLLLLFIISGVAVKAQPGVDNKGLIRNLLQSFTQALANKDSIAMYSLFAETPVTWVGVYQSKSTEIRATKGISPIHYKVSDYKTWFRSLMNANRPEERFSNPVITEDGFIGSITFDYSFWINQQKGNWGKESWGLVKLAGKWKIASVIYSMELEKISKQPAEYEVATTLKDTAIENYMGQLMDTSLFQGVVLVAKGDSLIHHSAYGMYDMENSIPNNTSTQFQIGSLTKSFTAVAVMLLVEKGKINLHAPISQYLPRLSPRLAEGLTVHHLLKLQAGFPQNIDDLTQMEIMDITPDELLNIINTAKIDFHPGKRYQYSNLSYNLLAMVIESAAGMKYEDFMKEYVFKSLQLAHSGVERLTALPQQLAVGYRKINNKIRRVQNVVSYALGSGDIYATAYDVFKWSKALHAVDFLKATSAKLLFDGESEDWGYYGYGFRIQPYNRADGNSKGTLIRHGGTMNGFISNFHYYTEDDLTVIILCNYRDIPIRRITYHLKELVLGHRPNARPNTLGE